MSYEINHEHHENYDFSWQEDEEGQYLVFRYQDERLRVCSANTIMYLFPDQPQYDHIFVITDDEGDKWQGIRLFREHINILAPTAFSDLCDQMFDRGFEVAPDEEPADDDIAIYNDTFGIETTAVDTTETIDKIVELAMAHIDAELAYWLGE